MTRQEIFDKVLTHLRNQGVASFGTGPHTLNDQSCLYRGPNGTTCAVGCLISDEDYANTPAMEGRDVDMLFQSDFVRPWMVDLIPHQKLLMGLQSAHDEYLPRGDAFADLRNDRSMSIFETHMQSVAEEFDINYAPPTEPVA